MLGVCDMCVCDIFPLYMYRCVCMVYVLPGYRRTSRSCIDAARALTGHHDHLYEALCVCMLLYIYMNDI